MFIIYKGKSEIAWGDQEKIMLNFHKFLTLEFSTGVTQVHRISKNKKYLLCPDFPRVN